jgi:hypothetical protein
MPARAISGWVALFLLLGCDSGFAPPSQLDSLRVLAVKPEPASGTPGTSSLLTLVYADGTRNDDGSLGQPREVQIAWFGACHNPPSRQYFACYPVLTAIAEHLSPKVVETPLAGVPHGVFGTGVSFELTLPNDILSSAPQTSADPLHYGVSYAFFAVCAGELRARPDLRDQVPVECIDPATGEVLGHRDFVTGFTTLFSYESDVPLNQNPTLLTVTLSRASVPAPEVGCKTDADCSSLTVPNAFEGGCDLVSGRCLPRVTPCPESGDCPSFEVLPELDRENAEPLPGQNTREILWASYYATAGKFDPATELVNDQASGWIDDHGSFYSPPRRAVGRVELWVTVNDQRGGADYQKLELLVREHD